MKFLQVRNKDHWEAAEKALFAMGYCWTNSNGRELEYPEGCGSVCIGMDGCKIHWIKDGGNLKNKTESLVKFLAQGQKIDIVGGKGTMINGRNVTIGCKTFTKDEIRAAITVAECDVAINFDNGEINCEDVTTNLDELKKIAEQF